MKTPNLELVSCKPAMVDGVSSKCYKFEYHEPNGTLHKIEFHIPLEDFGKTTPEVVDLNVFSMAYNYFAQIMAGKDAPTQEG